MARPRNIEREERERRGRPEEPMFVTWQDGDGKARAAALQAAGRALAGDDGVVYRGSGAYYDMGGGVSVRQGVDRRDYEAFRPGEGKPKKARERIAACLAAYDDFGIVRNIIDTMGDFCTQGVSLHHPNPGIEKFYQEWFYRARGPDVSEHIANTLFLAGNAPVRRHTARLKEKDVRNLRRGVGAEQARAAPDVEVGPPHLMGRREVPWSYTVMNPVQLAVLGGDLVPFIGNEAFSYGVEVPSALAERIKRPRTQVERELVAKLPAHVRRAINDGRNVIPLSSDKMHVLYYKRRHWQVWATPMIFSMLDDLNMLKKMKLADLSALDGAISHVRIWRLGSLEHQMMPTGKAIRKLAEMLSNAGNGVCLDLIWGPDLDLVETSTEIHRFLGSEKYGPVLAAIYAAFGIPPTLVGAALTGGTTNNFISLKTLTERLQYVRRLVREFWEYEVALVQQGMGFRLPASVHFDRMVLTDEAAEKALLIQLADRDLISVETIQRRFGEDGALELVRQRREERLRKKNKMPRKAGAFHNPQALADLKKAFVQQGVLAPSEVGIELDDLDPDDETPLEHKTKVTPPPAPVPPGGTPPGPKPGLKQKGQPQQGRPRNSPDTKKRKKRDFRVRTRAALIAALSWAEESLRAVEAATAPAWLKACGKKNLRQLSARESDDFEKFKFGVLVNLPAGEKVGPATLQTVLAAPLTVPASVGRLLHETVEAYRRREGREPPLEKVREFMAGVVALHKADLPGG